MFTSKGKGKGGDAGEADIDVHRVQFFHFVAYFNCGLFVALKPSYTLQTPETGRKAERGPADGSR